METKALESCESLIEDFASQAYTALGEIQITDEARAALTDLTVAATARRV